MTLRAVDVYGKPFLRALLQDEPTAATCAAAGEMLRAAGASFTLHDVAAEVGVRLPLLATAEPVHAARRPPRKSRAA